MNPYAVKYGLGRALGGAALTFGMWLVFWFHRTRGLLDGELGGGRDATPAALDRAAGAGVEHPRALLALQGPGRAPALARAPRIPVAAYVAGGALAPAIMYSVALGKVNEFWDVRTHGLAADAPITGGEKILFVVGATLWVMSSAWMVLWVLVLAGSGPLGDVV